MGGKESKPDTHSGDTIQSLYPKKADAKTTTPSFSKDEDQNSEKRNGQNHKKENVHNNRVGQMKSLGVGENPKYGQAEFQRSFKEDAQSQRQEEGHRRESAANDQVMIVNDIGYQDRQSDNDQTGDTEVRCLKAKNKQQQDHLDIKDLMCADQDDAESPKGNLCSSPDTKIKEEPDIKNHKKKKTKKAKNAHKIDTLPAQNHHPSDAWGVDKENELSSLSNRNLDEFVDPSLTKVHTESRKKKHRTSLDILKDNGIKVDESIKHMSAEVERLANQCRKETVIRKTDDNQRNCCPKKFAKNLITVENYISKLQSKSSQLETDKNECLNRLSSVAGARLLDNNPNIANLGDQNRPTKLAEEFSKLYDDEWTDAYEILIKMKIVPETAVYHLYGTLKSVYETCKQKSELQLYSLAEHLFLMNNPSSEQIKSMLKTYTFEHKKLIDFRKETAGDAISMFQQTICKDGIFSQALDECHPKLEDQILCKIFTSPYFKRCVELCWMMVIQDPPMYIETTSLAGTQIDKESYKEYTISGSTIQYVVWPALYLFKDDKLGPLMSKGVVQPM